MAPVMAGDWSMESLLSVACCSRPHWPPPLRASLRNPVTSDLAALMLRSAVRWPWLHGPWPWPRPWLRYSAHTMRSISRYRITIYAANCILLREVHLGSQTLWAHLRHDLYIYIP